VILTCCRGGQAYAVTTETADTTSPPPWGHTWAVHDPGTGHRVGTGFGGDEDGPAGRGAVLVVGGSRSGVRGVFSEQVRRGAGACCVLVCPDPSYLDDVAVASRRLRGWGPTWVLDVGPLSRGVADSLAVPLAHYVPAGCPRRARRRRNLNPDRPPPCRCGPLASGHQLHPASFLRSYATLYVVPDQDGLDGSLLFDLLLTLRHTATAMDAPAPAVVAVARSFRQLQQTWRSHPGDVGWMFHRKLILDGPAPSTAGGRAGAS